MTSRQQPQVPHLAVPSQHYRSHEARFEVSEVSGYFGRGLQGEYRDDPGIIKYLHVPSSPRVNFDLKLRHKLDEERDSGMDLGHFYRWFTKYSKDKRGNLCPPQVQFVMGRSMLQALLETPYTKLDGWFMNAVKLRGTIYLYVESESTYIARQEAMLQLIASKSKGGCSKEGTDDTLTLNDEDMQHITERMKEACSFENSDMYSRYGSKFEQHLTSSDPNVAPDPSHPLRRYDDFCCMMRARLGDMTLMYAGEMDCVVHNTALDLTNLTSAQFVELKTVKEGCNPYSHKRYRLLKCWSQCVLAKCSWMLLGHRDDTAGVVRRLERIKVDEIPSMVDNSWKPDTCFKFAYSLLSHVKNLLKNESEGTEFQFEFRPTKDCHRVHGFKLDKPSNFLPEQYVKWLKSFPEPREVYVPPGRRNNNNNKSSVRSTNWRK